MKTYILLASFRGEDYIDQQLDSILRQSEADWTLLIRDDGSDDATLAIIDQYVKQDHRVQLLQDQHGRLGTVGSFLALCKSAYEQGADYVLFSDQDDYWEEEKVSRQLKLVQKLELGHSKTFPIAAYCDLTVVDKALEELAASYMQYKGLQHPEIAPLGQLIFQNTVTGCATIINRALLSDLCKSDNNNIIMHDWWIALLAASNGILAYDPYVGIKYRQHDNNQIGVNKASLPRKILSKIRSDNRKKNKEFFRLILAQATAMSEFISDPYNEQPILNNLSQIDKMGLTDRLTFLIKSKIRRSSFLSTILLWIRILSYRGSL